MAQGKLLGMKGALGVLGAGVLLALLSSAPPAAAAEAPWWQLSSSSTPTSLRTPVNQVDELKVTATGGEFELVIEAPTFPGSKSSGLIAYDAGAATVQAKLEATLGAGAAAVSGGPGDAEGAHPYRITFLGPVAGQAVKVTPLGFPLTGTPHGATVTPLSAGAPSGQIRVALTNLGDEAVNGVASHVTITDRLPPGLTAIAISSFAGTKFGVEGKGNRGPVECSLASLTCSWGAGSGSEPLPPYERIDVSITVEAGASAPSGEVNEATVTGGGLPGASVRQPVSVNGAPPVFGVERYELSAEEEGGLPDTRAGSHPFQLTTTLALNQTLESSSLEGGTELPKPVALPKDLRIELPPGLIGNPTALPQCSELEFTSFRGGSVNLCPPDTAIGVASVTINEPKNFGLLTLPVPVFNLVPAPGEPARFGFEADRAVAILDTSVRSGGDYGVTVSVDSITQLAGFLASRVTLWGVPGDPRHDRSRGWECVRGQAGCAPLGQTQPAAFLTLPTSCAGPSNSTVEAESWVPGASFLPAVESPFSEGLEGCGVLPFGPSIGVAPEGQAASTPSGLNVDVKLPQGPTLEREGLAEADVKDTTVALPQGVQLSPAAANGLQACSEAQVGFLGEGATDPFSAGSVEPLRFSTEPSACPPASKIGTVQIRTPLLSHELEGGVYLAAQNANPFGTLVALYLLAEDPVSGVRVKLAGKVTLNEATGQATTTFENTPQLPFEELKLEFFGGPRAALTTPPLCGTYTTTTSFTPWSGGASQSPSSSFQISSGPSGAPCENPQPFAPSFNAQTTNLQAGAFTPFALNITRPDADQALQSISMTMPPGVAAMLSSVTPCPEPQAAQGSCPPASLIGHTTVSSGLGPDPYTLAGQVFLTGPYKGAPFGLSIVTPAVAGPFNLGNVIVRSSINVNPHTAAVTITSDPLPTMLKGIPTQLQDINVTVDRPGFEFNPTNCSRMTVTGTLTGAQGATAAVSSPFQVANCQTLPFKPKLTALTQGRTSKANGASLHVKVTSGPGQANIAKTVLVFPKVLPSRLTTIQKACVAGVFEANPAACPEGSVIGTATIHTPILNNPLTGPGYLVSHGGAAFPDVEFVLQGEGITLILDGQTNIHKGITSSSFNAVPDAPFTSFDAVLPEGPHSALTSNVAAKANYSLCGTKLVMPTTITGQNGDVIKQETKIAVGGCGAVKAFKATRAQLLAKALKACKKKKNKSKRAKCEKQARKKYGPVKKAKDTHKAKKK